MYTATCVAAVIVALLLFLDRHRLALAFACCFAALALVFGPTAAQARAPVEVIGVTDGDTLTVLESGKPVRIRLANVDAPEKNQQFGQRSKQSLSDLCFGKSAVYAVAGKPSYGRTIATVACDGVDVNRAQVERGLAWVYTKYNTDSSLVGIELQAQVAQRGLWIDRKPIAPWIFRRGRGSPNGEPMPLGAAAGG